MAIGEMLVRHRLSEDILYLGVVQSKNMSWFWLKQNRFSLSESSLQLSSSK